MDVKKWDINDLKMRYPCWC